MKNLCHGKRQYIFLKFQDIDVVSVIYFPMLGVHVKILQNNSEIANCLQKRIDGKRFSLRVNGTYAEL